jgi:singapore isolate B (sub-type 7) whole genome shotgun sequence assembly, scaffold_11
LDVAGKSSFLNRCIAFSKSSVSVNTLLSLSADGVSLNRPVLVADEHFQADYWNAENTPEFCKPSVEPSKENPELLTTSAIPSTTLGVTSVRLRHATYLLYDTPGICSSPYRVKLLTMMLTDNAAVNVLFPRKRMVPTVFSMRPGQSILLGALGCMSYRDVENVRLMGWGEW